MAWNVLDLFSGIGGMSLGLERAGMRTIAFCDSEPFCRDWLDQQWPGVPCFEDVRQLHAGLVRERVDVIAGGFPCQDVSVAGKGAGIEGERSGLWVEMFRLVRELRPRWVLVENVPALRTRGADRVLGDLESEGYTCMPLVVGADDVGAPHRRKRVWIVAVGQADGCGDVVRIVQQRMPWGRPGGVRDEGETVARDDGASVALGLADSDGWRREGKREQEPSGVERASWRDADGRHGASVEHSGLPGSGDARESEPRPRLTRTRAADHRTAAGASREGLGHAARGGLGVGGSSPSPRSRGDSYGAGESGDGLAVATGARRQAPWRVHARALPAIASPSWPARPGQQQHACEPPRVVPGAQRGLGGDTSRVSVRLGSAHRRARLKALGNSVVPQIVEAIGRAMIATEEALLS